MLINITVPHVGVHSTDSVTSWYCKARTVHNSLNSQLVPELEQVVTMLFQSHIYASFVLVLFSFAVHKISALNYASVNSADGGFMLQWTYKNSMLMFKLRCKTTGWCGVGFTTTASGRGMVNYDIAVGGFNNSQGYINVSQYPVLFFSQ